MARDINIMYNFKFHTSALQKHVYMLMVFSKKDSAQSGVQ
jgi:hypothetical protein